MAALPYMQFHIAEYLADTSHLSTEEHGAYLLLIFNYWQRGKALDNSNGRLSNVVRMSNERWTDVARTLADFFTIEGDLWIHGRIERDLKAVNDKCEQARNARSQRKSYGRSTDVVTGVSTNVPTDGLRGANEEKRREESKKRIKETKATTPTSGFVLPDWVDVEAWEGFVAMRRTIRKPLTDRGMSLAVAELQRLEARGHPHTAVLNQSTMSNWQGLFELKGGNNGVTQGNSAIDRERRGLGAVKTADSAIRAGYVPFGRGQSHVPQPGASRDDGGSVGGDVDGAGSGVRTTLLP